MATVRDVKLAIKKVKGSDTKRHVTVSWENCYTSCEVLAGSVFVETVTLRGDDPIWDDHLTTLLRRCVKAERGCQESRIVRHVSRTTLDEDGDTIIFGIPVHAARDEVYARVRLEPFEPSGDSGRSSNVTGQFGPAGND